MSDIKRRVYSPRGDRGGGGLVAQVTIDEEDVRAWVDGKALARIETQRRVVAALQALMRDVVGAFEEVERRQPGGLPAKGNESVSLVTPGTSTPASPTTGPIPTEQKPT